MKYSLFIGRWQPLHKGHLWLINERLKEGKNVWLAIRDVKPDEGIFLKLTITPFNKENY